MGKLLTVTEVAEAVGVSADTVRRWNKKGLIKSQRSPYNYRLFKKEEVNRLHNKLSGKSSTNNYKILKSKNKSPYSVIELFAGAGGTALGMENAGLIHKMLIDNDKNSILTLKKNMPNWNSIEADVTEFDFKGLKADIVQGGFPCQAFSYAGEKRGFDDTRGTLFFDYARCVKAVKPKIAIAENVRGARQS